MERLKQRLAALEKDVSPAAQVSDEELKRYGLKDITLRPYQLDGVNWLIERFKRGHGCILGDEMGLGKTCQSISFLVQLSGGGESQGPHLILCPLSVLANWQDELQRFAPGLKVLIYTGDKEKRATKQQRIKSKRREIGKYHFNVMISTYEMCLKDVYFLERISWHSLIVDEAHRLKNKESQLHLALKEFKVEHSILLTGTPVQNNLQELYSLLSFIAPTIFKLKNIDDFVEQYSDANQSGVSEMHSLLKPFLLRRIKSEVIKDLPRKAEVILFHGLSALQKKYYKAILSKDIDAFHTGGSTKTRLMNILMQLRKCVNHPYLFDGAEPEPFQLGEHLIEASGKLTVIDRLLTHLKATGHKVLLFSQMTHFLDILQDYLGYRGFTYERLDGSVRGEERYLAVKSFNEQDNTFVFLLSTKAGGQGLNLTSADTVIFADSDFNPQNDLQAAARAHRIGQTRPVKIIRLIGRSTVDEIILRRAEAKLKLTNSVIEGGQFSLMKNGQDLVAGTTDKLQDILKFGLDKIFENSESSVEDVDFRGILGPTVDGCWQPDEEKETEDNEEEEDMKEEENGTVESMYVFEGTDYSQEQSQADDKVIEDLLKTSRGGALDEEEEDVWGERASRRKNSSLAGLLPESSKRQGKKLSPEELEERKKGRAKTAARRAKEEEEEQARKAQEKQKRRLAKWKANDYVSSSLAQENDGVDDDGDEEREEEREEDDDEEEKGVSQDIQYVSGDVTKPVVAQTAGKGDAFIVHCVDDSGSWGQGGLFSAVSRCSQKPQQQYELAGQMRDLVLGDAHLISMDDIQNGSEKRHWCVLVVAQTRDRRGNLSGVKLSALSLALTQIYSAAKKKNASVHLPRIGYNTPGFNWYGTERLIRKHLAAKGIPTYIYYFPRKHDKRQRSSSEDSDGTSDKKVKKDAEPKAGPSLSNGYATGFPLPSFMEGVRAFFYEVPTDKAKILQRYLIAYDGDVHKSVDDSTTHVITTGPSSSSTLQKLEELGITADVPIVSTRWLRDCFVRGKKVQEQPYLLRSD